MRESLSPPGKNWHLAHKAPRVLFLSVLMFASQFTYFPVSSSEVTEHQFTFSASGDHGASAATNASLTALARSGSDFYIAVGDLSYDSIFPESKWCEYVKSYVGPDFPFEIMPGDDDIGIGHLSHIDNFAACLPDKLNSTGKYGTEYYFDYPPELPLARFILIAANLTIDGVHYDYTVKNPHYTWLSETIDQAREKGISWIIVGVHKPCITMGIKSCEIGADLMNLLINKRVDLVLYGHDHNYQRSKQLTCAIAGLYVPSCVANDGVDGVYKKGDGTVLIITGIFGRSLYKVSAADAEAGYFAKAMGADSVYGAPYAGIGFGFVQFNVSNSRIDGKLIITKQVTKGTLFADSFSIMAPPSIPETSTNSTTTSTTTTTVTIRSSSANPFMRTAIIAVLILVAFGVYWVARNRRITWPSKRRQQDG